MTFEQMIEQNTGYTCFTTFGMDFAIAERFGTTAIKDTYKRAFKGWKDNCKYFTELVIVLNHKIWQWYNRNEEFARVYNDLWEQADNYACENFKGEDADYYFSTTD